MRKLFLLALLALFVASPALAKKQFVEHKRLMDHGDGHLMDMDGGIVMGYNPDVLPGGCNKIGATREITVHAGRKYAKKFPGRIFAFDIQEYQFEPCTKLTVNFVNDDEIRHQWMVHGLPKYLYPKGMFHLELTGPGKISGTLIFPPNDKTYLVHCDISQHMEKGMKGQIKIGSGSGDLPSIPGVTAYVIQDDYSDSIPEKFASLTAKTKNNAVVGSNLFGLPTLMIVGLVAGLLVPLLLRKCQKMSARNIARTLFTALAQSVTWLLTLAAKLVGKRAKN